MSSSKAKKERRKMRHLRNIAKEVAYKKQAWENGKLIEENHNQGPYSPGYTQELAERLYNILKNIVNEEGTTKDKIIYRFRQYKMKIRDLILHWSPETEKNEIYNYLKGSLEVYWDDLDNLPDFLSKY